MTTLKHSFSLFAIVIALSTLIVVRLILPAGSYSWINTINFTGLIIAIGSLFFDMCNKYMQNKNFYSIVGWFVIFFVILVIIDVLILTNILNPSSKANDSIMLLTLLISLPSQLYVDLVGQLLKK